MIKTWRSLRRKKKKKEKNKREINTEMQEAYKIL